MTDINKIIIVQHAYGLTTPKTQRMLAAAKEYVALGLEVVFIISSDVQEPPFIDKIRFIQIDENRKIIIKCFYKFIKTIQKEYSQKSVIFFDGAPLYAFFFQFPKYRVFSELSEIPYAGHQPTLFRRLLESVRFFAVKHYAGLQVISEGLKKFYEERGVKNIAVINMFVDRSRFDGLKKNSSEKYIAYCGTISLFKDGVDVLIKAFSIFSKTKPDYKLKIIGGFENSEVESVIRKLVKEQNLQDIVEFTGRINSSEMPQMLFDAEILALSRPNNIQAQYGFPTKLGEYLATGNPVVVTKVGEIPLFLKDKYNAILSEPGDEVAFSNALLWVVKHQNEARSIGLCGKELVESVFSSKVQATKSINFINSLFRNEK